VSIESQLSPSWFYAALQNNAKKVLLKTIQSAINDSLTTRKDIDIGEPSI
jgi:hypothetical protein